MQFFPEIPHIIQKCIYLSLNCDKLVLVSDVWFSSFIFFRSRVKLSFHRCCHVVFCFFFSVVFQSVPAHYVCSFHQMTVLGNWTSKIKCFFLNHPHVFHNHFFLFCFTVCIFMLESSFCQTGLDTIFICKQMT